MRISANFRRNFALVCLTAWAVAIPAPAATIEYVATNLTDVTPGEDLWRYDYTVGGRNFLQAEFFDIYFAANLFRTLTAGPAPSSGWDVAILQQPNPVNFPPFDRGMFDAFALVNGPSLAGVFSVSFVYLGSGSPGAQTYQIFGASSNLLETGLTSAPTPGGEIPEPSTFALLTVGLAAWAAALRRRGATPR